jgi:hypothetical protein
MSDGDLRNYMELAEQRRVELERVKAERDHLGKSAQDGWQAHADEEARLDKALALLARAKPQVQATMEWLDEAAPGQKLIAEQWLDDFAEIEGEA